MYYSKALSRIPVVTADAKAGRRLHRSRRAVQLASIAVAILIPVSGLFRIDPVAGAFVVLDRQIWFSDFYIVVGFWMAVSASLVMTYSLVGTGFCGWVCPQNTLSEWANHVTRKLLGKRAEVSLDGARVRLSPGKNKWINWAVLGVLIALVAMVAAFIPMFYFYPPGALWSFITFRDDPRLAGSLHWIYTVFVLIVLVDIAFIRHFWCRFMCVYRVWQHTFKTTETLRIVHDKTHPEECARCNFCETACFIGIDPRNTEVFDACINCGACITACSGIRNSRGTGNSLLKFELGHSRGKEDRRTNVGSILLRAPWATLIASSGLALFAWGLWSYSPYHYSVYRAETRQAAAISDYRINIANKLYRPAALELSVEGLPAGSYRLERRDVRFETAGRTDVNLHIDGALSPGLHPFLVHLKTPDGQRLSYRVEHFVSSNSGNGS
jgi:polyferredoxin